MIPYCDANLKNPMKEITKTSQYKNGQSITFYNNKIEMLAIKPNKNVCMTFIYENSTILITEPRFTYPSITIS